MGSVNLGYSFKGKDLAVRIQWREIGKRSIDIILSLLGLVVLAPLFPLLWIVVRLDSPGSVIFRQQRVGQHGHLFTCLKIRTMFHGADESVHKRTVERIWAGEQLSSEPSSRFKLTDDVRITPVGHWLRRTSIDELPQLLNVLRGEMSIVGPRPAIPYELKHFMEWHHERHNVKPGLTGLWQVRGRGALDISDMLKLDVEYARTWSLWLDLKLIVLSVPAVLKARGAG
jgi:lipopolysaccharide/colanic/teichoic acid biosynthesis glycosyltransferase